LAYTRENANNIDLNRDAQALSQPESIVLNKLYLNFKPDYCFNLHDQRTIYSAGKKPKPATLSFLSPAADETRGPSPSRDISMQLIAAMYHAIRPALGDCVGRYDDSFNLDCTGDYFQSLGTPTLLLEAGHFPGDYAREETRKYVWYVLLTALIIIARDEIDQFSVEQYKAIPNNEKLFFDVLIRNAANLKDKYKAGQSVGIQLREVLHKENIEFQPAVEIVDNLDEHFGHLEFDCEDKSSLTELQSNENIMTLLI
ncbi:MAG: peptidase M14, partial [Flavobacteriaceae bacterium]